MGVFWGDCLFLTLKALPAPADKPAMFALCHEPLPLSEACLLGLCASLNAPVVHSEELPPGPARAAIVTFAEEYGGFAMAVGIRALESGKVVVYRYREPLNDATDVADALEDGLSFAERLGFLFDDDMIDPDTGAGRSEGLEHWLRLTGSGEIFTPGSVAEPPVPPVAELTLPGEGLDAPMEDLLASPDASGASEPGAEPASELLLDDLMDAMGKSEDDLLLADDGDEDILDERIPDSPTLTAVPLDESLPLSKFRAGRKSPGRLEDTRTADPNLEVDVDADLDVEAEVAEAKEPIRVDDIRAARKRLEAEEAAASTPEEAGAGGAALGRIPIVRRRKGSESGRPGLLSRLLASF